MATFGSDACGGTIGASIANTIIAGYFSLTEAGLASKITACLYATTPGTYKVKCAIYDASNNFVAETEERSLSLGVRTPYDFNFSTPPSLSAGNYYLAAWGNGGRISCGDPGTGTAKYKSLTYDGFPDPISWTGNLTNLISIYCTYEPVIEEEVRGICYPNPFILLAPLPSLFKKKRKRRFVGSQP